MKTLVALLITAIMAATSVLAGPAPAISYLEVIAVRSQNKPSWEYISRYQFMTNVDHSGTWVQVVVDQHGYGTTLVSLNGVAGKLVMSENLLNGRTVYGFRNYYQFNVKDVKTARFVTTAYLMGGRTLSDLLTIK